MEKSYKKRFQMFSELLSDPELVNYARKNGNNTFSRNRKMPLKDMLLVAHISISENELAKRNLKHLKEMEIRQPILVVFDRGYPSIEFIDFLEMEGIHYLIRLSSNDYKAERKQMQSEDEKVILKHSSARLQKIRQKHQNGMNI